MSSRVVVITGAGSGLGASLARRFSQKGLHVVLLGRTREKLEKAAEQLPNSYSIYPVDVSLKEEVTKVFTAIREQVGDVDVLVNNAGVGRFAAAEDLDQQSVDEMIDINLKGTIFCTQEVLRSMKQRNQGDIVNIVSTAGREGKVHESVYCASKFGVRGFCESLASELRDTAIRVAGVYMGGMKTAFWNGIFSVEQVEKLMDPESVAEIILANLEQYSYLSVDEIVIKNKKSYA
jgi:uncharacterized protein